MGFSNRNLENSDKIVGEGIFISEKMPKYILIGLGLAAVSSVTIGYMTGSFNEETQTVDEAIVECAVVLSDENPTLNEAVLSVGRCDTLGSLDEFETEVYAQKTLDKVEEVRD